jgi:hypothetical protein
MEYKHVIFLQDAYAVKVKINQDLTLVWATNKMNSSAKNVECTLLTPYI